jgi:glycosyltransferase involved in cell wall biosynthesis
MNPKLSIILPTYNGEKYLERAIKSVLVQSYRDFELIIIDDCSTDRTPLLIQKYAQLDKRVRPLRNSHNLGIQKTLNHGLNEATGEFIARIDDDDFWTDTNKLKNQIEFLESNPDHVLVGTAVIVVDENSKELLRYQNPLADAEIRNVILYRNCFAHASVVFRRLPAVAAGGYSELPLTHRVEDYDLWLKLGTMGKFANLPDYALGFTMRSGSISWSNKRAQLRQAIAIIERYKAFYPRYRISKIKAWTRYILYSIFGSLISSNLRLAVFRKYKNK